MRAVLWVWISAAALACASASTRPDAQDLDADGAGAADGADGVADGADGAGLPASIRFELQQQVTVRQAQGVHLAFPAAARLADGRILLVYREGDSHVDASGRIVAQYGAADASEWEAPRTIVDTPDIDDRDPSVRRLADGSLLLTWFQYRRQSAAGTTLTLHQIFAARSADSGESWSPAHQISEGPMQVEDPRIEDGKWLDAQDRIVRVAACSSPAVEHGGRILLMAYVGDALVLADLASAARSRISLISSQDGESWSEALVAPEKAPDTWLMEPALAVLADGTWLVHIRTADGTSPSSAGALLQSRSADGRTWSDDEAFGFVGHAPDLLELRCGALVSAFRELDFGLTHEWVSFVHSIDRGQTWSEAERVADCGRSECGYPSLVELDADRLLVVYYGPGGRSLEAAVYGFATGAR
ncbi:MAG: exo-alpha-sialidase [Deltaproteobacteria bacterium]|nr:exo-alpha-sialidase [Deltaproteobacteria bacterium]